MKVALSFFVVVLLSPMTGSSWLAAGNWCLGYTRVLVAGLELMVKDCSAFMFTIVGALEYGSGIIQNGRQVCIC
ncbi:hypothetical protein JG687_00018324 [Phytophthora cactorum]|uniref:Uncharacterized protein n=1 Tax=Phytophthora cactorum TaxID=29920 RepID=A0A8T1TPU1_9STRA|nr:hypothetical protein JG687_00018324 [Phytophthora cactorum]